MLHGLGEFLKAHPAVSKALVIILGGFAALMATFGTLTIGLAGILGPMIALRFMLGFIGIQLPGITGLIAAFSTRLMTLAGTIFPAVTSAVVWLGRALFMTPLGAALAAIGLAALLIYQYWTPIKTFFSNLWLELKQAFSEGIGGLSAFILNWSPVGLFHRAMAEVLKLFGIDIPLKFTSYGKCIIDGLWNGIRSGADWLTEKFNTLASKLGAGFASALGIKSPSRVFAAFGGHITDGLALGLDQGQDSPVSKVGQLARRLAQAGASIAISSATIPALALDTLPAGSPATRNSGAVIVHGDTIHLTVQASSGMDEAALARAIAAVLDQRDRQKAIRIRSSFSDY